MIELKDVLAAREVIKGTARNTPLKRSTTLSESTGADFYLKLENFQRTGSFKVRGAVNKMNSLTQEEREKGVVAASAGNHAQGTAFAATRVGVRSDIFMPVDAPHAKVAATKGYGAVVHLVGKDYQEAYEAALAFQAQNGSTFVHAYDDEYIMAGQGTLGLELVEELPDVQTVLVPIGGGGLMAGVATVLKAHNPNIRIIGVQAEGASTIADSLIKGEVVPIEEVNTIADGIACRYLGKKPFAVMKELVDEVVTVSESEIAAAILFLLERTKVTVEGAGAVTLAAAMHKKVDLQGQTACAVISGGNIDITLVSRIIQQGLVKEGRVATIQAFIKDKPGAIASLLNLLAAEKANVLDVRHSRYRTDLQLHQTAVVVEAETQGPEHIAHLRQALADAGYKASVKGISGPTL
ncbi:MAG: threonine ammonia-lyase [Thermoplasmatota archaeon]